MAGNGPAPKPNSARARNHKSTFDWVLLPAEGRTEPPPPLPEWRDWSEVTTQTWNDWWATPQATAWDPSGRSLWRWLILFEKMISDPEAPVTIHTQLLAIEDRHGFTPAAMLKLRWRIVGDELAERRDERPPSRPKSAKSQTSGLAARLRPVPSPEPVKPAGKKPARKRAAKPKPES
jgi:hypothetical protein